MNQARSVGNEEWWKIHEAVMLALGSTVVSMERHIDEGKVRVQRINDLVDKNVKRVEIES